MKKIILLFLAATLICSCTMLKNKISTTIVKKMIGGKRVSLVKSVEIPFEIEGQHVINVSPVFNDYQIECVFDTGGLTFVDSQFVKYIGGTLNESPQKDVRLLKINTISINNATVRDINALVINMSNLANISGMIGSSFIRFFQTEIDYRNNKIVFSNPSKLKKHNDSEHLMNMKIIAPYFPTVQINIGDKKIDGMIDTGLNSSFVFPIEMMSELSETEQKKCIKAKQIFMKWPYTKKQENYYYVMPEIIIDDIVLKNVSIIYAVLPPMIQDNTILIGKEFLEEYVTVLDYEHKKVLLRETEKLERDFNFSTGINIIKLNDKFILHGIWENSSAVRAGLLPEDKIVKFEGNNVNEISNYEIQRRLTNPKFLKINLIVDRNGSKFEIVINKEYLFEGI